MDYEKAYKDALERAKKELNTCGSQDCDATKQIFRLFPELTESEDERMKKSITRLIKAFYDCNFPTPEGLERNDLLAWLEKQRESSNNIHYWTEEEIEPIISDYLRGAEHYGGMIARLRCLKPKQKSKWSKEDECNLQGIIGEIQVNKNNAPDCDIKTYDRFLNWLKSLTERLKGE